ncbi:uncharacterized protein LOC128559761 [Mercenaria mercenaria]|uniref:uncharacterized protein LOC128559761 n=1 Tax=Mercenaria mercenaria TaxID=6596 RepID=UPI00234ED28F|nr:uncharacterized protein LOC128559761 [Mercenaria mercenaria]
MQDADTCIPVDSSTDTMMLVIILSSVVGGLTLVVILFFICFCQYRRKIKGAADTNDKPVKENRSSNHNVLATSIRSTVREEEYDTIGDESDIIDVNALRVTKNKDDGYLDIVSVNRNELAQTYEKGVVRNQINEYLDLNAVEQDTQDEYDYAYEGHKLSEKGYVDVSGVRRKLPEIPKNFSTTGKEGANDPYSELKHKKLPEHMYERMADQHEYLKPVELGNVKPDEHGYLKPVGLGNGKPDEHGYLKPVGLGNVKPDEHGYLKYVGLGNVKPDEHGYLKPVGLGNVKPVGP